MSSKIQEAKQRKLNEIAKLAKENDAFLIASTVGLPSGQFQEMRKKLRNKAEIHVVKKTIVAKAIDAIPGNIRELKPYVNDNTALIFSKLDPFQLSAILSENKSQAKAKKGQVAEFDILVESGPTDLVPGPAISELQSLGLKIAIEDGKIHIKEGKIIVKTGEIIKEAAASLMNKLNIQPFSIGFEPIAAYSSKDKKVYRGPRIDKKKTLEEFKTANAGALAFAVSIAYASSGTIKHLIIKASQYEKALYKLVKLKTQPISENDAK